MLERAKGQFVVEGNVEEIFGDISGAARIARISQTCVYTGALEAESIAEYTAVLPREGDGGFQGFQRISGKLGEREGTFVVGVTGEYHRGQPRGRWTIVPKSGSGDFQHMRGDGEFELASGKPGSYRLEFDLRKPRAARAATESQPIEELPLNQEPEVVEVAASLVPETRTPERPARRQKSALVPTAESPVEQIVESRKSARRKKSVLAVAVAQPPIVAASEDPPAKPARRRKTQPAPEPIAVVEPDSTAPTKPSRQRTRKTVDTSALPVPEDASTAKRPARHKKSGPVVEATPEPVTPAPRKTRTPHTEPIPISLAKSKSTRQRRSKAA